MSERLCLQHSTFQKNGCLIDFQLTAPTMAGVAGCRLRSDRDRVWSSPRNVAAELQSCPKIDEGLANDPRRGQYGGRTRDEVHRCMSPTLLFAEVYRAN